MPYDYKKRIQTTKFYDSPGVLSPEMEFIRKSIEEVAIDDLNLQKFHDWYYPGFLLADFTEVKDLANNKVAGFLFATFHENTSGGNPKYIAKAFHAVKKEYRQTKDNYDRTELYKKFIEYYAKNILKIEWFHLTKNLKSNWIDKGTVPTRREILNLVNSAKQRLTSNTELVVDILAENPTTYSDICKYGLDHPNVDDQPGEYPRLRKLKPIELMKESFDLFYQYETGKKSRPQFLEKTNFTVNTSHLEWLNFFERPNDFKRFYLWQNFGCPQWAFRIKIPVNPDNILNALFAIMELKGYEYYSKFLGKNSGLNTLTKYFKIDKKDFVIPKSLKKIIKKFIIG